MAEVLTVCPYCGFGCGIYLHTDGKAVTGRAPSRNHPVSRGNLRVKGWQLHAFMDHPDRPTQPLLRKKMAAGSRRLG